MDVDGQEVSSLYLLPAEKGCCPYPLQFHGALSFSAVGWSLGFPAEVLPQSLDKEKKIQTCYLNHISINFYY